MAWHKAMEYQWEVRNLGFRSRASPRQCADISELFQAAADGPAAWCPTSARLTDSRRLCRDLPAAHSWSFCLYNVWVLQQRLCEGGRPLPAESGAWNSRWRLSAPEHTANNLLDLFLINKMTRNRNSDHSRWAPNALHIHFAAKFSLYRSNAGSTAGLIFLYYILYLF